MGAAERPTDSASAYACGNMGDPVADLAGHFN